MKKKPDMTMAVVGFVVHSVCGAVFGAILGLAMFARSSDAGSVSGRPALLWIGGSALIGGLLAGVGQDEFWSEGAGAYPDFRWKSVRVLVVVVAVALLVLLVASRLR